MNVNFGGCFEDYYKKKIAKGLFDKEKMQGIDVEDYLILINAEGPIM